MSYIENGQVVVCTDNYDVEDSLTLNKEYKVYVNEQHKYIFDERTTCVVVDRGNRYASFSSVRFKSREDVREDKLNQLGI